MQAELWAGPVGGSERRLLSALRARVSAIESRLAVIEQRVGTGPDTSDLDQQIEQVRAERAAAADADADADGDAKRRTSRPPCCATGGSNC